MFKGREVYQRTKQEILGDGAREVGWVHMGWVLGTFDMQFTIGISRIHVFL